MNCILTVDFGSTWTKMCSIDADSKKILGTSRAFTTIQTDVREGYEKALGELEAITGKIHYNHKLACSSAGGGLKMIACGLVPELTAKAAKMAASSAGAKVIKTFSYEINACEQEEICRANPDILLLCGGTDGGNREVIIKNAGKISRTEGNFSVIYAGNKSAADDAKDILEKAGKHVIVCGNVMPIFNILNIEPAKEAIRSLFIEKIVDARGLGRIQKEMTAEIIPTPLAVLEGAGLLSAGCEGETGLGSFMAVDAGGATTDVYSLCSGEPSMPNAIIKGLPEPFAKRSVEGDLGIRYNIDSLADSAAYIKTARDLKLNESIVRNWVSLCKSSPELVSQAGSDNRRIDEYLTRHAVKTAAERHCGTMESVYTPLGETIIVTGKDLTGIRTIIGTGGPIINSENPAYILEGMIRGSSPPEFLKPEKPKFFLDKKYIFASLGLAGKIYPALTLKIFRDEIAEL